MTVKEFKSFTGATNIKFSDLNGKDISDKPEIILDELTVIGSGHHPDGSVSVDVDYTD